jgi:hypothetical protein
MTNMQLATAAVQGAPDMSSTWILDDDFHRGWNVRLVRMTQGAYLLGLLVSDVRFEPPVLLLLAKSSDRQTVLHETMVLEHRDPGEAMSALELQESEALTRRSELVVSREWLRPPGTEQWTSVRELLELLESRELLTGEYRIRQDAAADRGR